MSKAFWVENLRFSGAAAREYPQICRARCPNGGDAPSVCVLRQESNHEAPSTQGAQRRKDRSEDHVWNDSEYWKSNSHFSASSAFLRTLR
jgi:hypothetical protein